MLRAAPDVIEWRVDHFRDVVRVDAVLEAARSLRKILGTTPLLFTRRSPREGGEPSELSNGAVLDLYAAVCQSGCADMVDVELDSPELLRTRVREAAARHSIALVLSHHDFRATPAREALVERFVRAQELGADVAKLAVMPRNHADVLTLLAATQEASEKLKIPLISMSMGTLGAVTRMIGWMFGSALTFGIAESGSAPGQLPVSDLNTVIEIARRASRGQ